MGHSPVKRATVEVRSGSDVFEQALLGADGSLDPDLPAGAVGYARVFPSVSVVYQPTPDALKETIVLVDAAARHSFSFWISGRRGERRLRAELQSDRSILMRTRDGQTAFELPPPFMYDSVGAGSRAVAVSVRPAIHHGARGYQVTMTADDAWLSDPARRYPVAVDPTVITNPICIKLNFHGYCNVEHSGQGPDVPGYENLSVPLLIAETEECLLDPEQPGLSCDVEGLVPAVNEGQHEVGLPRAATSGATANAAQVGYAVCGAGVTRPKRDPGPGRTGPYFVTASGKSACAGNAVRSASVTACLAVNKSGTYLNLDCTTAVSRKVNQGAFVAIATARWCCEPGRHFYRVQALASGTVKNGSTVSSDLEEEYTRKKIRC